MPDFDVLVIGAGPTGLLLANELVLAGVRVAVAEQAIERTGQSRALSLQPRSAEILEMRGWLEPIARQALAMIPSGHFAGIPVSYAELDTRFRYQLGVEQAIVEEYLEGQLDPVLRGQRLVSVRQDEETVTATFDGPRETLTARYLVGADGAHSTVRKLLDADFPGRDGRVSMAVADVVLESAFGTWELPSFDSATPAFGHLIPLRDGKSRVLFAGPEQQELAREAPISLAEVQRAVGDRARVERICWASRFTDASRQVSNYRHGRVFLAGDAAHIHLPIGGQGLNLGLGDAFNLGWKLAAQLGGRAPAGLLDTYHRERHPVAAATLASTRAQGVLTVPDEDVVALRDFVSELLSRPETLREIAERQAGLDVRYELPGIRHPLLGVRMPDVRLADGTWLSSRFRDGKPVLLGDSGRPVPWVSQVDSPDLARYGVDAGTAVLVRPDGQVCWVGEDPGAAVAEWFGAPVRPG